LGFGGWKSFGFNREGGDSESERGFKAIGLSGLRGADCPSAGSDRDLYTGRGRVVPAPNKLGMGTLIFVLG
jgi:hypothetical protein